MITFKKINMDDISIATVADLVICSQEGDREAFGELVVRFENMVYSIALRRCGDYSDAQELVQDVFVKALEKIHQLKTPAAFGGWLRSITVRTAINRGMRKDRAVLAEPAMLEASSIDTNTPFESALASERAYLVHDGLGRLTDLDRRTLEAFYMRGESLIEMAASFEAPLGTIKRRLHVARKRLAVELKTAC